MPEEEPIELEPNEPQPLKFKVVSDDYKATTTLDENWQAKPFLAAVVKPVAMKLNKRPDKEPVSADRLERVEIDGVEVDFSVQAPVASVVPAGASTVELFFGLAPPKELKFSVSAGGNSEMSFTITLDSKFMQKTFHDAVIVPFVTYYNRRVHMPVEAKQCVVVHVDGQKVSGATGTMVHKKTALQFVGRSPAYVELFFSWEAASAAERAAAKGKALDGGWSRLAFKVAIAKSTDVCNEKELHYSHAELTAADGAELGKKLLEYGPLAKLKHLYLEHNTLADGLGQLGRALNRKNTPALKRLILRNNRITSAGVVALAAAWVGDAADGDVAEADRKRNDERRSPRLDILDLEDNRVNSEGAEALGAAVDIDALTCREVRLHGNPAITPATRERLKRPEITRQGVGVNFTFDSSAKGLTGDYYFVNQRTGARLAPGASLGAGSKNDCGPTH